MIQLSTTNPLHQPSNELHKTNVQLLLNTLHPPSMITILGLTFVFDIAFTRKRTIRYSMRLNWMLLDCLILNYLWFIVVSLRNRVVKSCTIDRCQKLILDSKKQPSARWAIGVGGYHFGPQFRWSRVRVPDSPHFSSLQYRFKSGRVHNKLLSSP